MLPVRTSPVSLVPTHCRAPAANAMGQSDLTVSSFQIGNRSVDIGAGSGGARRYLALGDQRAAAERSTASVISIALRSWERCGRWFRTFRSSPEGRRGLRQRAPSVEAGDIALSPVEVSPDCGRTCDSCRALAPPIPRGPRSLAAKRRRSRPMVPKSMRSGRATFGRLTLPRPNDRSVRRPRHRRPLSDRRSFAGNAHRQRVEQGRELIRLG